MKPSRLAAALAALLLLTPLSPATPARADTDTSPVTTTLAPVDDLYVRNGSYAGQTYLTDRLVAGGGRETLMRFDLSSLPSDTVITGATLTLYKAYGPSTTLVFSTITDTWDRTVTFGTLPALTGEVLRQSVGAAGTTYSFDLSAAVRAAADAGRRLSLHVTRSAAQNASEFASSRDTTEAWRPALRVTTMTHQQIADADAADLDSLNGLLLYQNLSLPTAGTRGSVISWASADPDVVEADGTVHRPTGDADADAVLTATVTSGSVTVTRTVTVTVRRLITVTPEHPQIYATDAQRPALNTKIADSDWAGASVAALRARIDPLANRHLTDPAWILSRMSMYWTEGQRCTQVYMVNQNVDRCEGDAPVPTVRMSATRVWNSNGNAPLADRIPYSDGPMRTSTGATVPYAETGHMVRGNNQEILSLAQQAAFLYWTGGDEKYAKFAGDIYWQWLLGTYYMKPPLDPNENSGGPGGYAPGGIMGYYDQEVIHDTTGGMAAVVYDFLYDYLQDHPSPALAATGGTLTSVSNEVLKRFIDISRVRGGYSGNWNTNSWALTVPAILALETNDYYPDGHGREYYLKLYTTTTTQYHQALPDILTEYNPVTGLWHESPPYSFGTIGSLLDLAYPVGLAGVDTIAGNPVFQKAAMAIVPWLDARGNMVVLGDGRGGSPGFTSFERLLTYYTGTGDTARAAEVATVLRNAVAAGQHDRNSLGWLDIIAGVDLPDGTSTGEVARTAYSAHHRHLTMKNGADAGSALMATLYGGHPGTDHLSPNGLAMQLYGQGWALGPNAKGYESYWSGVDYAYASGPAGANTIVPGYTSGPITVNAVEPAVPADAFTSSTEISANYQFSDVSAAEKRRQLGIVRTSPTSGYYVDVFRSDQADNDYLYHNLGTSVQLKDADGRPLATEAADLGTEYGPTYALFTNEKAVAHTGDFTASWQIPAAANSPATTMTMWMTGQPGRTLYTTDAPSTTTLTTVTPGGINRTPDTTPTVVVRQRGTNAATAPFAAVYEADTGNPSVRRVTDFASAGTFAGLRVDGRGAADGRTDYILTSTDATAHTPSQDVSFTGGYGVVSTDCGRFASLYLGNGTDLRYGRYRLAATGTAPVAAGLETDGRKLRYTANAAVRLTLPLPDGARNAALTYLLDGETVTADSTVDRAAGTITATLPAGKALEVRVVSRGR